MIAPAASVRTAAVREGSWAGRRAGVAVLLVLLYASASTARWVHWAAARTTRTGQDEISTYERRFEQLRSALPARGVIGYLGHPDAHAAALLHFRLYLLTQYTLAPLLLIESTEPDLVVGNFDAGPLPPVPAGFQVLRDFGEGLVLYRRSSP